MKNAYLVLLVFLACAEVTSAKNKPPGDQEYQVVTKTIRKDLPYRAGDSLFITAEKADIHITSHRSEHIELVLRLISRNPDKEMALKELDNLKYSIEYLGNLHQVNNFFVSSQGFEKVSGILTAQYELKVPEKLFLQIQSRYGSVILENLRNDSRLDLQFIELALKHTTGTHHIAATFGNTLLDNCSAPLYLDLQRSNLKVYGHQGKLHIQSYMAEVGVWCSNSTSLHLEGKRTSVELTLGAMNQHNYNLTTTFNKIWLPGDEMNTDSKSWKKSFMTGNPELYVNTTYRPVRVNLAYNAAKN